MEEELKLLKTTRQKLGLTLQQVADATNIRANVLEAMENGELGVLPRPYIEVYVKDLTQFYQNLQSDKELQDKLKKNSQNIATVVVAPSKYPQQSTQTKHISTPQYLTASERISRYINKNRRIFGRFPISIKKISIYSFFTICLAAIIYFVFVYVPNPNKDTPTIADTTNNSARITSVKDDNLFAYFDKVDSVILTAKCIDSAWVKVILDNKVVSEVVMVNGMSERWAALEKISLSTSNVGSVKFYKNDTLLPPLGATGTTIRNIIIERNGVANLNPLTTSNAPVTTKELKQEQPRITPSSPKIDTANTKNVYKLKRKKKEETTPPPMILDFSNPTTTKPPVLEKKEEKK